MADIHVYRTYPYDKDGRDPVCNELVEAIEKDGLDKKASILAKLTGLSTSTIYNLRGGKTRSPRYLTVMNIYTALGYYPQEFKRTGKFDLQAELHDAKRWALRRQAAKLAAKGKKKNGNGNKDKSQSASA
jgi:hypothetical protein